MRRRRQLLEYRRPYARVLAMDRRPDEALKALGSRGFDAQVTASLEHRRFEMVGASRGGHHVRTEPGGQRVAIGDRPLKAAGPWMALRYNGDGPNFRLEEIRCPSCATLVCVREVCHDGKTDGG